MFCLEGERVLYKCYMCRKTKSAHGEIYSIYNMPQIILEGEVLVCGKCISDLSPPFHQLHAAGNPDIRMRIIAIGRGGAQRIQGTVLYNIPRNYFIALDWFNVTNSGTISDLALRSMNFDYHIPKIDIDKSLFDILSQKLQIRHS